MDKCEKLTCSRSQNHFLLIKVYDFKAAFTEEGNDYQCCIP
jgi:hypothetical protein